MYVTAFVLGFFTSFGWWSAGKIQKAVDNTAIEVRIVDTKADDKKD